MASLMAHPSVSIPSQATVHMVFQGPFASWSALRVLSIWLVDREVDCGAGVSAQNHFVPWATSIPLSSYPWQELVLWPHLDVRGVRKWKPQLSRHLEATTPAGTGLAGCICHISQGFCVFLNYAVCLSRPSMENPGPSMHTHFLMLHALTHLILAWIPAFCLCLALSVPSALLQNDAISLPLGCYR